MQGNQGDPLLDLPISGGSSGSRGALGRAKLQGELALKKGGFFTKVMQAAARRLNPTEASDLEPAELKARGLSMAKYLKRFGGYGQVKNIAMVQWQVCLALDHALSGQMEGCGHPGATRSKPLWTNGHSISSDIARGAANRDNEQQEPDGGRGACQSIRRPKMGHHFPPLPPRRRYHYTEESGPGIRPASSKTTRRHRGRGWMAEEEAKGKGKVDKEVRKLDQLQEHGLPFRIPRVGFCKVPSPRPEVDPCSANLPLDGPDRQGLFLLPALASCLPSLHMLPCRLAKTPPLRRPSLRGHKSDGSRSPDHRLGSSKGESCIAPLSACRKAFISQFGGACSLCLYTSCTWPGPSA